MVRLRGRCRHRLALLLGLTTGLGALAGCVERRYTIRSNPPGALAIVNGEEVGPTPISRSFTYYGDREITLMLAGHETLTTIQPINAPWWDNVVTEFFTENLIPYTFRDEREYIYQLAPSTVPEKNDLLARAEALRAQGQIQPPPRRKWLSDYVRGWIKDINAALTGKPVDTDD
jgi:hypothetical protein